MNKTINRLFLPILIKTIISAILLLCFSACRELVQDEFPDFIPVPTVNSILIAGDTLKLHVSLAGKIDTNRLSVVKNANIALSVNGLFKENLTYVNNGLYISNTVVEPQKTYQCKVSIPYYDTITCTAFVPSPSEMSNIIHINNAGKDEEGTTYPAIQFTFSNNPHKNQYFEVKIKLIHDDYEQEGQILTITDPILQNEGLPLIIFGNELITDTAYTMLINYTTGSASSYNNGNIHTTLYPFILELRSVNYDYYKYVKSIYLYDSGRFPSNVAGQAVTAFPIYSNIENAYGIFAGYSKVVSDTIYPEPQIH